MPAFHRKRSQKVVVDSIVDGENGEFVLLKTLTLKENLYKIILEATEWRRQLRHLNNLISIKYNLDEAELIMQVFTVTFAYF